MKNKLSLNLAVAVFLFSASFVFAQDVDQNDMPEQQTDVPQLPISNQDPADAAQESPVQDGAVASLAQSEPEVLWVWGEVAAVDLVKKSLTLKYLDYESDEEKDIDIVTNEKTGYESIKSLDDITAKSVLSVDYIVQDGLNIAKNISFERGELPIPGGELTLDESAAMSPAVP